MGITGVKIGQQPTEWWSAGAEAEWHLKKGMLRTGNKKQNNHGKKLCLGQLAQTRSLVDNNMYTTVQKCGDLFTFEEGVRTGSRKHNAAQRFTTFGPS